MKNGKYRKAATFSLSGCPLRGEKSSSQRAFFYLYGYSQTTRQSEELSVIAMMSSFLHSDEPDVLLPHFSCHSLRHTFTTRMCEAGVNIKVIQDALGHSDISTALNIYADVTKEMKAEEFKGLDSYFKV